MSDTDTDTDTAEGEYTVEELEDAFYEILRSFLYSKIDAEAIMERREEREAEGGEPVSNLLDIYGVEPSEEDTYFDTYVELLKRATEAGDLDHIGHLLYHFCEGFDELRQMAVEVFRLRHPEEFRVSIISQLAELLDGTGLVVAEAEE